MAKAAAKTKPEYDAKADDAAKAVATDVTATVDKPKATKKSTKAKAKAMVAAKPKAAAKKSKAKAKSNSSEKIREMLTATPDMPVAEIAKKVGVTPGLIYNIKTNMKKKSGKAKRGRKPGSKNKVKTTAAPVSSNGDLDNALDFISSVGGLVKAERLIGTLKSIKERL